MRAKFMQSLMKTAFICGLLLVPVLSYAQTYSGGGFDALRGGNAHNACRGEALSLHQSYTEILQIIQRIVDCNKDGQVYVEGSGCEDPVLSPDHVFAPSDTGATLAFYNANSTLAAAAVVGGAKGDDITCVEVEDADDPANCEAPWGSTVVNGGNVRAYQEASVPAGETCRHQTRTCTSGTLSGTYTFANCTVEAAATETCGPWQFDFDGFCTGTGQCNNFNLQSEACGSDPNCRLRNMNYITNTCAVCNVEAERCTR